MKPKVLPPVRPNAGSAIKFRDSLYCLIDEMTRSVEHFLKAQYKRKPPAMASDETPSQALQKEVRKLVRRWQKNFDDAAPKLARYYSQKAERRSAKQLQRTLKEAGFTVRFKMTKKMRDVMDATIAEQVGLIRSIPQKYLGEVEGMVMRSVQQGRDLSQLSQDLQKQYGVTKRRAALIARDQNNKATASMTRVRHQELGIEKAVWLHSHGGKVPRPTHLANNGNEYIIAEGWFDPDEGKNIWPGELINCRCVSKPVVEGFS